ncbi:MAG TPA: type II secretion system F family protein [Acidimicrobiales bacterium]|jgi:pilus assembly protein TadC
MTGLLAAPLIGGLMALFASQYLARYTVVGRLPLPPSTPGCRPGSAKQRWLRLPRLTGGRRALRRRDHAVIDQLPDVVDLLRLTTQAGLPVSAAIAVIGARPGGELGAGLSRAARLIERGSTTAEALRSVADNGGPPARPLVDALADHDRYGTPIGPILDRLGIESRLRRRRHAEEEARRLPVTLLFPLVFTTLPAFVALTIVPLLAGSFSSLRL